MSSEPGEIAAVLDPEHIRTRDAAFVGVRNLATRHLAVGLLSALGTTFIVRRMGPQLWGAFGVAYLLLVTADSVVSRGVVAGLLRQPTVANSRLVASAERLALLSGVVLGLAILALAFAIKPFYDPPAFTTMLIASAIASVVYAARAVPSVLLERDLRYGPIALSEVADNAAFYAVAVPMLFLKYGVSALAAGTVARAFAAMAVVRFVRPTPWLGVSARDAARRLLPFGLPLCATFLLAAVDGLVAVFVIGDHQRQLGYLLVGGTVLGYAVVITTAATRVALPSFSRVDTERLSNSVQRSVALSLFLAFLMLVPGIGLADVWVAPIFGPVWDLGGVVYLQVMGVALMAISATGVLSGALLARGESALLLRRHAIMLAAYIPAAILLTNAFGPVACVVTVAASRWLYALLLWNAARRPLGFLMTREIVRVVILGGLWLASLLLLAHLSHVAAVIVAVLLGVGWLWAFRDLGQIALHAARQRGRETGN